MTIRSYRKHIITVKKMVKSQTILVNIVIMKVTNHKNSIKIKIEIMILNISVIA